MRGRSARPSPHVYGGQAVYGLEVGNAYARRHRRVRHVWNQAVTVAMVIAIAAGVVGGAWLGYQVYLDHKKNAEIDHQLGVEEMARKNAETELVEVIDDLGRTPTFNGPSAPVLGLGPGTTQP